MFKIEKKPFGVKLTFGDFILKAEMEQWLEESKKALTGHKGAFGVFVDMRALKPLPNGVSSAARAPLSGPSQR